MIPVLPVLLLAGSAAPLHESPIDHVDRVLRMSVEGDTLILSYRLRQTARAAFLQLRAMDKDGDGRVSDRERDTYFESRAALLAGRLDAELGGGPLRFRPRGKVKLGADLSQTFVFEAPLGRLAPGVHRGRLKDLHSRAYPGRYTVRQPRASRGGGATLRMLPDEAGERPKRHPDVLTLRFELRLVP